MYGEWLGFQQSMTADNVKAMAATDGADEALFLILEQQKVAQDLHEKAKYCAPEILTAIERDELRLPQRDRWPRYCSLLNPLCRLSEPDNHGRKAIVWKTDNCTSAATPNAKKKACRRSPCRCPARASMSCQQNRLSTRRLSAH